MEQVFPGLRGSSYEEKSPSTVNYNCIAWAAGETHRCWWPIDHPRYYWPRHILKEESIPCFLRTFQEEFGYEVCPDGQLQRGYEKVALYVDPQQIPTHMARQLPTGVWTSKLGDFQDIEHHTLEALEGKYIRDSCAIYAKKDAGSETSIAKKNRKSPSANKAELVRHVCYSRPCVQPSLISLHRRLACTRRFRVALDREAWLTKRYA